MIELNYIAKKKKQIYIKSEVSVYNFVYKIYTLLNNKLFTFILKPT